MTLRTKPVSRGSGRSGWDSGDRRTFLLNVGFVIAIAASALILVGVIAVVLTSLAKLIENRVLKWRPPVSV